MYDLFAVLATCALFAVALAYVAGCDRIKGGLGND